MQAVDAAPFPRHADRGPPVEAHRSSGLAARVLTPVLRVDAAVIERGIERMRRHHPFDSNERLARRCVREAACCAGVAGLVLAVPNHPLLAIPAAAAELVLLARLELVLAARIASIYSSRASSRALLGQRDLMRALEPLLEADAAGQVESALKRLVLRRAGEAAFERAGLAPSRAAHSAVKAAGLGTSGRRLFRAAIPVAGAFTAARRVAREGARVVAHFESAKPVAVQGREEEARVTRVHFEPTMASFEPAMASHGAAGKTRGSSGGFREAAVGAVAALFRASDTLASVTRRARGEVSSVIAEGRSLARTSA